MKDLVTVTYITYIFQIWYHYYHEQVASIFWVLKTLKVHDSRQWILLDSKMTKVHSYYVSTTSSSISKRQCVRIVDQPDISLALACLKTPQLLKMITFCGYVFQTTYSIASSPDSQNKFAARINLGFACLRNICESVLKILRLIIMWPGVFNRSSYPSVGCCSAIRMGA